MAEGGFEAYHVPQQSRRDKLRGCADHLHHSQPLHHPPSDFANNNNKKKQHTNFIDNGINIHNNNNYMDLQSSLPINPNISLPFLYQSEPLSLSLSSNQKYQNNLNVPPELNLQRHDSSAFSENDLSTTSSVPLGPFTGYSLILKGSRFLKPAHQLLDELCDLGGGRNSYAEKITDLMDTTPLMEDFTRSTTGLEDDGDGVENRRKKSRLVSMLDEVYRKYKQYYQQVQAVVASFETVAGLSSTAPFANLALKAMSKHFWCLKNAITDQLQFATKFHAHTNYANEETPLYGQRSMQNLGFIDHQPIWRPQRGLPERAVTVLRAWLFEHFLHPYPTDTDKLLLAKQTGLSRNQESYLNVQHIEAWQQEMQVSNWFINARVRLWKPMVEEMHTLETRQAQKPSQDHQNANQTNTHFTENPPTSTQRINQNLEDLPSKRTRNNDFPHNPIVTEERMNFLYNPSSQNHIGAGMSSSIGTSGGVSLTLGLHQNNGGVVLLEPFPMNAARRLGLDLSNEGFVMGGLGRDMTGGQLLHDFVG